MREVVKRGAAEHSRWVHFIAEAASLLRRPQSPWLKPDRTKAHKYAVYFHQYGRFLAAQNPPLYCVPLHDATAAWLHALELLSLGVSDAIAAGNADELESLVRGASEAQIRLRTVQRMHGRTMDGLKKLYEQRPAPTPRPAFRIPKRGTIWR
jgi:hypothetical protein